jgi:hypothetical protein
VTISSEVDEFCEYTTAPGNVTIAGNEDGDTGSNTFEFECNFAGTGTTPLTVSFDTAAGQLINPADALDPADYTITYTPSIGGPAVFSGLAAVGGVTVPDSSFGVGATNTRTWVVALDEDLDVAGVYSDTVTVTLAP